MMANSLTLPKSENYSEVIDTFKFLSEGEKHIKLSEIEKITLILGATGSGKSTLAQFIAGDNTKLKAVLKNGSKIDYNIEDEQNTIGSGSISKTILPELKEDFDTGMAYYDCPGFSDNRNASMDIASTYFIKKVIDDAKFVKIVFAVSESTMSSDRGDHFKTLLLHASHLVKNMDKYKESVVLVVTKVEGKTIEDADGNQILVNDGEMIGSIANSLVELKEELGCNHQFAENPKLYANSKTLIDAFLTKIGETYDRIGIFRRPKRPGPLSENVNLQKARQEILKVIQKNSKFTATSEGDFSYTISAESKNHIHGLVKKITESTSFEISNIGQAVKTHYDAKEQNIRSLEQLSMELKSGHELLLEAKDAVKQITEQKKFIKGIFEKIENLGICISKDTKANIERNNVFLDFLGILNDKAVPNLIEWSQAITTVIDYLQSPKKWYDFLIKLYFVLSLYEIQKDTTRFDIPSLLQRIKLHENDEIEVKKIDLKPFLNQLGLEAVDLKNSFDDMKNIKLNEFKLKALKEILDSTLNNQTHSFCQTSDKLEVKGNFVKLSDINAKVRPDSIRYIEIFALYKVFIDTSIKTTGKIVQFSIIAPTWEVVGNQKISLDGEHGNAQATAKAENGVNPGDSGIVGNPGLPGGQAGNFLGIGQTFINSEQLTISANGGKGGSGQNGGDGCKGKDGEARPFPYYGFEPICFKSQNGEDIGLIVLKCKYKYELGREFVSYKLPEGEKNSRSTEKNNWYEIYGTKGTKGGNGGDGGKGGIGGENGTVKIFELTGNSKILFNSAEGKIGNGGKGGQGGMGGKNGGSIIVKYSEEEYRHLKSWELMSSVNFFSFKGKNDEMGYAESGSDGTEGINNLEIVLQKSQQQPDYALVINNYKAFLLENLKCLMKRDVTDFYDRLSNDDDVKKVYDSLRLLGELKTLETRFNLIKYENEVLPFYQSLLSRISEYASNPRLNENSKEYKKVLGYLYSATLSKACSLKNGFGNNLIIDIREYLDLSVTNINKLSESTNEIAINTFNKNYKDAIDLKVKEATDFIDQQIAQEIDKLSGQVDEKLDLLIKERIKLQKNVETENQELLKNFQGLEKAASEYTFFGILKCISKVIGVIVPMAKIAVIIIDTTCMIVEFLEMEDYAFKSMADTPRIIESFMKSADKAIEYVKVARNKTLEIWNDKDENKYNINAINEPIMAIRQVQEQDKIDELKKYEQAVYSSLISIVEGIRGGIRDFKSTLPSRSQAALDIGKWKIQSSLRDVKLQLLKFTRGFEVQEDFARLIEKLDETMNTLINIYDRIQEYQEKKTLADYIAAVSSPASNIVVLENEELRDAVLDLEKMIKSNIVLAQYEAAISGFKQFIFPFADLYLEEFKLPTDLALNDTQSLIASASKQIQILKDKISISDSFVNKHDKFVFKGEFDPGENENAEPFFVWDNNEYKDSIAKILAGEEISLIADVTRGVDKNALKIKVVGLNFRTASISMQNEINNELQKYQVYLTHLGNSYYRCNDKFYLLTSEKQKISYSFAKNNQREPLHRNNVYEKIKNGDRMLSPYAMWSLKLTRLDESNDFSNLKKYCNQVDLELVGRGQYVDKNFDCNLDSLYKEEGISNLTVR